MDSIVEMIVYSVIPLLFIPLAFGVWYFKHTRPTRKLRKAQQQKQ